MFIVIFARIVKYLRPEPEEETDLLNYSEFLWPWLRRFVWLWVKHWRYTFVTLAVGVTCSHYLASGYGYTVGYFWAIYAPVCGLFFNLRHHELDGEGPYYINTGCATPLRNRIRRLMGRF